jgi:hypothetical protein
MAFDKSKRLPWQITASKLIEFAKKFRDTNDDFERQVGYLLLDVGVETIFRTYITMPNVKTEIGFKKREDVAKRVIEKDVIADTKISLSIFDEISFHKLVEVVKQIANQTVSDNDLEKAEYYHSIRNKIYHQGDGIVPTKQNFEEYLTLAESFLQSLLILDLNQLDPTYDFGDDYIGHLFSVSQNKIDFARFQQEVAVATAIHHPEYALSSFEDKFKEFWHEFVDIYNDSFTPEYIEVEMIDRFQELTGKNVNDLKFALESSNDVTLFRFALLLLEMGEDVNSNLEKYLEFRKYSKRVTSETQDTTKEKIAEEIRRTEEFSEWIKITRWKINSWVESKIRKD